MCSCACVQPPLVIIGHHVILLQVLLMLYHLLVELLGNSSEMARLIMKILIDVSDAGGVT